jgi:DNA-binding GntR family transcriptional regulator
MRMRLRRTIRHSSRAPRALLDRQLARVYLSTILSAKRKTEPRTRPEQSLVEKIRLHLEEQIIAGRLKPRQRLVEEDIARELSASRSPLREALRLLEREGLVTSTRGKGARVADLTTAEVEDVYAIRSRLGGLLFALAAQHIDADGLSRLEHTVDEMARVTEEGDVHRYFLLDLKFEEIVEGACHNAKLVGTWRNLGRSILRFRYFSLLPPGRLRASLDYHRQLVAALTARDAPAADRLAQSTIDAGGQALRSYLPSLA